MKAQIYKTNNGYEVLTSDRRLYLIDTTQTKLFKLLIGQVGSSWQSTGKLIYGAIPNRIKTIFFQIQKQPS
jgi:hypothetical protein